MINAIFEGNKCNIRIIKMKNSSDSEGIVFYLSPHCRLIKQTSPNLLTPSHKESFPEPPASSARPARNPARAWRSRIPAFASRSCIYKTGLLTSCGLYEIIRQ